jgi:hypothetical protein
MAAGQSSFSMQGARSAIDGGVAHIGQHVEGIEQAIIGNPGLAFDLAKTLVESVCRAVLDERSVAYDETDDLPKLFKAVSNCLPFLPPAASGEAKARESLKRTLSGLSTAIQGICELRNQCGFASHGSGRPRPALESVQALLAAQAADAVVGFLHRVHLLDRNPPPMPLRYEANQAFNDYVDETHESLRVFEVQLQASKVLFEMEPESYRVYLAEFEPESEDANPDTATGGQAEVAS